MDIVKDVESRIGQTDNPGVILLPPIIYLIPLFVGIALRFSWHFPLLPDNSIIVPFGLILAFVGTLLMIASVNIFKKFGEEPDPRESTHNIVTAGPFKYSRNPMYLAFTIIYVGITVAVNTWWLLIFLPLVLVTMHFGVILREEAYLEQKFGKDYLEYKKNVRRWL